MSYRSIGVSIVIVVCLVASPIAAQDEAVERLNESPRHQEWVQVKSGDRVVHAFVVYPEVKEKVPVIIVIHENRGLNDWARSLADQVAEAGYIAVAPDLLSGTGPEGGKTSDFTDADAARDAIYALPAEQIRADLNAVAEYAKNIPASNGTLAVGGFCWGGSQTWRAAASRADFAAAFVFYGTPADTEALASISCPVYGFYGENDERVNATIEESRTAMKGAGRTFEPVIYAGAGHGFMRSGEEPGASEANAKAREDAWKRWKELLAGLSARKQP